MPITDVDIGPSEIVVYPRTREFNLTTHWLSYLYASVLAPFDSGSFWKCWVELYPERPNREPFYHYGGEMFKHYRQFDFERYFSLEAGPRKRLLLETLQDGLLKIAVVANWPQAPFEAAYQGCLDRGLEARFSVGKPKLNRRRTAAVGIEWYIDMSWVYVYATFCDRDGKLIGKWEVVSQDVGISAYFPHNALGRLSWVSDDTVRLTSRNAAQCWDVTLDGKVTHRVLEVRAPGQGGGVRPA